MQFSVIAFSYLLSMATAVAVPAPKAEVVPNATLEKRALTVCNDQAKYLLLCSADDIFQVHYCKDVGWPSTGCQTPAVTHDQCVNLYNDWFVPPLRYIMQYALLKFYHRNDAMSGFGPAEGLRCNLYT